MEGGEAGVGWGGQCQDDAEREQGQKKSEWKKDSRSI